MDATPSPTRTVQGLWHALTRLSIALWQIEQIFLEPERSGDWLLAYA